MKKQIVMLLGHDFLFPQIDPRVYKEAKTLIAAGYKVVVICLSSMKKEEDFEKIHVSRVRDFAQLKKYQNCSLFLSFPRLIVANIFNTFYLIGRIRYFRPAIIHANDADTLLAGAIAKLSLWGKSKLIYDSHEIATEMIDYRRFRFFIGLIERSCAFFTDGFITVNPSVSAFLLKRYPPLKKKALILINSPLVESLPPIHKVGKKINFLYQGNLKDGRDKIVKAFFDELEKYFPHQWTATLITTSDQGLFKSFKEKGKINFKPIITNRAQFLSTLSRADIGIVPGSKNCLNNFYSLPNKLFDYLEAGLVPLLPDLPEIKRIMGDEKIAYFYNVDNDHQLRVSLRQIFIDKEDLMQKKNQAQALLSHRYTWQKQEKKLIRFYQSLD